MSWKKNWNLKKNNVYELLDFIEEIWWQADTLLYQKGKNVILHTGGWSGNEDIIKELFNSDFWIFCWEKTVRGGHYYFKIPKSLGDKC